MRQKFFNFFAAILWAGIIFLLSSIPGNKYPQEAFDYSLFAHFGEYFVLTWLIFRAIGKYSYKKMVWILILTGLFAISDEVHQSFIAFREVSLVDWIVDMLGILVALTIFYVRKK